MVHHVVSALTMTKLMNIAMKNENDALLLGTYIKQDIENTIIKEATVLITLILTMKN
jgi:hypothetical protein